MSDPTIPDYWRDCAEQAERELGAALAREQRLRADIECMIQKAADKDLAGYRDLGDTAARAENERDAALERERRLREALEAAVNYVPDLETVPGIQAALADKPEPSGDTAPEPATPWRTHTGSEPPPELAPAQMVEAVAYDDSGDAAPQVAVHPVCAIPWDVIDRYRPLLDSDGLPYVSGEGLEPWAKYVATDRSEVVYQYADYPPRDRTEWFPCRYGSWLRAPATHAILDDWRQSLAKVWRTEG